MESLFQICKICIKTFLIIFLPSILTQKVSFFLYLFLILNETVRFLMGFEKWTRRPTYQTQRRSALDEAPKPLASSPKRRSSQLGPKGRLWIIEKAHILQIKLNPIDKGNRIILNNILSCKSNQISPTREVV